MATRKKKTTGVDFNDEEFKVWGKIRGEAKWAFLTNPDQYGKYGLDVYPTKEGIEELQEKFDELVKVGKEAVKKAGKKILKERPYVKTNEGKSFVSIKMNAKTFDGVDKKVKIYDAHGKIIKDFDKLVGNGSIVNVKFLAKPYWTPIDGDEGAFGISLKLIAVQLIDLQEYTGGGDFDDEMPDEDYTEEAENEEEDF